MLSERLQSITASAVAGQYGHTVHCRVVINPCIELSAVPNPMKSKPKLTGLTCNNIPPQPSTSIKEKVVCSGEHKTQATPSVGIVTNPKILGSEKKRKGRP